MSNTTVKETSDYSIFEKSPSNRNVSVPQVNKIRRSMYEHGYLKSFPISCIKGEKGTLIVTDGQHRLEAAKALNLPVMYVVEAIAVDPSVIPNQKKWDAKDFLQRYAAAGNEVYQYILSVANHFGVSHRVSAALLTDDLSNNRTNEFRSGKAQIRTKESAMIALQCAKDCVRANPKLLINPLAMSVFRLHLLDVDFRDLAMRVETNADQMVRFNSIERGFEEIEKAYNYRLRHDLRLPLAMLIKQKLIINKRTFGRGE